MKMIQFSQIRLSVLALSGTMTVQAGAQTSTTQKQPNVLFISADDLNSDMQVMGNPKIPTPNLDRLARMGVTFTHAYNQSPLCGPSRASIMTGYRPDNINVHDLFAKFRSVKPDAVTIPQMFMNNSYYTCRIGKIFHAGVPSDIGKPGSDDPSSWNEAFNPIGKDKTDEHKITILSKNITGLGGALAYMATEGGDDEHTDGISANMALKILRERYGNRRPAAPAEIGRASQPSKPFFMAVGFYRPHCPFVAPQKYFDMFPLDKIELPPFAETDWMNKPEAAANHMPMFWGLNKAEQKEIIRAYYASVAFMDAQVGKLLDGLEELGLAENTIVVFWSDQGYMLGEHGLWQKQNLFEKTAVQPLIIAAPGYAKGRPSDGIVEMIDIYPTLAELAGLAPPADLDGKSLVTLLKNPDAEWNYPAFTQQARTINPRAVADNYPYMFNPMIIGIDGKTPTQFATIFGRSVRVKRYRYTEWEEGKRGVELYDYETDPNEFNNLATDPEYRDLKTELAGVLHSKYQSVINHSYTQ